MKLVELLEGMKEVLEGQDNINNVTILEYQDYLIRASENKNTYIHAAIVYDLEKIPFGEWTQKVPLSIIYSDKVRTNDSNKLYIHSNTLSCATESTQLLRNYFAKQGCEGLLPGETNADIWTHKFGDALLAGTKLDFNVVASLGGFCDIIN